MRAVATLLTVLELVAGSAGPAAVAAVGGPAVGQGAEVRGADVRGVGVRAGQYRAPVSGTLTVLRRFDPPSTPYGPGHLGVDLAAPDAVVVAAGAGVVRFAGQVAGRGLIVILHPDGISTEYEPLVPLVRVGSTVTAGQPIGRLAGLHRGCPAARCLHWGAQRAGSYLDPLSLLRPLGVVRLLPWDA